MLGLQETNVFPALLENIQLRLSGERPPNPPCPMSIIEGTGRVGVRPVYGKRKEEGTATWMAFSAVFPASNMKQLFPAPARGSVSGAVAPVFFLPPGDTAVYNGKYSHRFSQRRQIKKKELLFSPPTTALVLVFL
nr:hypothetical protein Iba_chr05cCG13740 [Ipomoea batatas]